MSVETTVRCDICHRVVENEEGAGEVIVVGRKPNIKYVVDPEKKKYLMGLQDICDGCIEVVLHTLSGLIQNKAPQHE